MIKRMNILLIIGCFFLGAISCNKDGGSINIEQPDTTDTTDNTPPPAEKEFNYIFQAGTEGYSCFRIPAIVRTKKGTLLAFAEARKYSCSDEGDINLVLKRSLDSGRTWSTLITVWDDGGNTCGNPAPVVDQSTGNVYLLMTWNLGEDDIGEINNGTSKDTRRVFVTSSTDDGQTWETPKEITDKVKKSNWGWYATGPCHGIQLTKGTHTGRLVIPCDYIEKYTRKGGAHVIYSDDHGKTWKLGGAVANAKANESSVAELSNGDLLLNMRNGSGFRKASTSMDGGMNWSKALPDPDLPDPTCQGSLLSFSGTDHFLLLFSNAASSSERVNMTINLSTDDGNSWRKSYRVHEGPSAYSDIVMISKDHIGILYEGGKNRPYEGIIFENIPINQIK